MNKERLLNVARALRESPAPNEFTMIVEETACGTPCCAWGHYFHRVDLQSEFAPTEQHDGHAVHLPSGDFVSYQSPEVLAHFGIDEMQARQLFSSSGCGRAETPTQAAKYIERFVSNAR